MSTDFLSRGVYFKRLLIDSAAMVTASTIFVGWGLPLRFVITCHPQILQGRLENFKYMKLGKTDSCCADDQEKEYRATTNGVNIYLRWVANKACHIQHYRHELRIY